MLTPPAMLATKNRAVNKFILSLLVSVLLTGCTPPGPRAVLDGRRLLEEGDYPKAVEKLKTATVLMPTNAPAWNYLGLAYHRAGQPTNAVAAYTRALALNRDLLEARYNLGCLWLDENNLDAAKSEFTAYTLRRGNSVEGWLKLGTVQLRGRDATGAEKSYREALRLSAQNVEALNGLGLVQLQRNRPREAAQQFAIAVKLQPDYGPALLNLATVLHQHLNESAAGLQRYHEYLALKPQPENWEAVSVLVKNLEQPLAVPVAAAPRPPVRHVAAPAVANTNPPKPAPVPPSRPVSPARTETPPVATKPATAASRAITSAPAPAQVVRLAPEPVIKTTPDDSSANASTAKPPAGASSRVSASGRITEEPPPPSRGFFSRINPVNLFRSDAESASSASARQAPATSGNPETATPNPPLKPATPAKPAEANQREAVRAFAVGQSAQRANKLKEAMTAYPPGREFDPAYYEAYYNLGLTAYAARNYPLSLSAWKNALALRPDSVDARYNFALALKAADHPAEAAAELEKILAANPEEVRAHLVLGNLYAESLNDPARARIHYTKLLELSPRHPQAAAIRYWIVANPP